MELTGSIFPEPDAVVSVKDQVIGDETKFFVNIGELMVVVSEGQARQLRFELAAVLAGLEWEREKNG